MSPNWDMDQLARGIPAVQAQILSRYADDVGVRWMRRDAAIHFGFTVPESLGQFLAWRLEPTEPPRRTGESAPH